MKKVSINIDGHQTSFTLEEEFLNALKNIAKEEGFSMKRMVTEIDLNRGEKNLSSAIRVFVLNKFI